MAEYEDRRPDGTGDGDHRRLTDREDSTGVENTAGSTGSTGSTGPGPGVPHQERDPWAPPPRGRARPYADPWSGGPPPVAGPVPGRGDGAPQSQPHPLPHPAPTAPGAAVPFSPDAPPTGQFGPPPVWAAPGHPAFHPAVPPGFPPPGDPYALWQPMVRRSNGMAVAALVLGVLAVLSSWAGVGFILGVLAVVFGGIGIGRVRHLGSGKGMAVAGLVLGALGVLLTVAFFVYGVYLAIEENPEEWNQRYAVQSLPVVEGVPTPWKL
ncbi:DUF4190 domain-containing protein [Streptomyces sp. NPDC000594]|uniref:DUF4190 domain-containing protein n=1 Tax=Streptomyces sp. NPDC000594 TaxID=3154261 RepID=UPI00332F1250